MEELKNIIEIPYGAKDSELCGWEYTIPEGYEARIEGNKVIIELKESEDERMRKDIIGGLMWQRDNLKSEGPHDNNLILPGFCLTVGEHLAYLEKQKEQKTIQSKNEREYVRILKSIIADFIRDKKPEDVSFYQQIYDWLDGRHIEQKPANSEKPKEKPLTGIYWHAIKEGDTLPCRAYLWTTNYEKYHDCLEGRLIPNVENVTVGADMWYLPVDDIRTLPREGIDELPKEQEFTGRSIAEKNTDTVMSYIKNDDSLVRFKKQDELRDLLEKPIEQKPAELNDSVAKEMFIKALERAVEQTKNGYELTDCDKHSWWEDFKAYSAIKPAEWSERYIADIFEKVGLAKIVREQGNDELTNALQDAMLELSKSGNAEWSEDFEENIRNLLHDKLTWHSEDGSMSSAVFIDDKTLKDIVNGIWFYVGKEALKYPNKELPQPEWSEEDKHRLEQAINALGRNGYYVLVDWLQLLPERFNPQPKQEWSELQSEFKNINKAFEDGKKEVVTHPKKYGLCKPSEWSDEEAKMLTSAIAFVEHSPFNTIGKGKNNVIAWLKSLRPQPHWKPSEEQMESLMRTITWLVEKGNHTDSSILADLRRNLQKLM